MEEGPHPFLFVQDYFDEVVAGAQGAELVAPVPVALLVEVEAVVGVCQGFQFLNAGKDGVLERLVVESGRQGDAGFDGFPDLG